MPWVGFSSISALEANLVQRPQHDLNGDVFDLVRGIDIATGGNWQQLLLAAEACQDDQDSVHCGSFEPSPSGSALNDHYLPFR